MTVDAVVAGAGVWGCTVARRLAESPGSVIENEEFRSACLSCGVDPDSFTAADYAQLQRKLNEPG